MVGEGFRLIRSEIEHFGYDITRLPHQIRKYVIGRDLVQTAEERYVIDFFGMTETQDRQAHPKLFQVVLDRVKPQRDSVNRQKTRENYWLFAEPRSVMRSALESLPRYIVTCRTAKHRIFSFSDAAYLPDAKIIAIALDDSFYLGVLSSLPHITWAALTGAWLGIGNDSNYNHSECFAKFPFPSPGDLLKSQIRAVAEELDVFRKERQKEHPHLTLTQMYNVLEKLKANADLDDDDERIKKEGLILILKELHEKLDVLVFEAYGWPTTLTDEQILENLVALNHERVAEEKRGHVRWLRPDYQIPRFGKGLDKMAAKEEGAQVTADLGLAEPAARKASFPTDAVSQTAAVFAALAAASGAVTVKDIAAGFRGSKNLEKYIGDVLDSLTRLGHVTSRDGKIYAIRRVA